MRDILPPSSAVWNQVETCARRIFKRFNYREIRTPILEETALFARSVGEETDIVSKEMYTFEDRDGSSLTLRPENTASVLRAYIEHRLDQQPGLQKLYYIGPMFRRERPQKGRYRQFFQIGAEAIGSDSPAVDGEVIEMVAAILREVGIEGFELLINSVGSKESRARYNEALREQLKDLAPRLCSDCRRRAETNPLRVLDCKVPEDQPIIEQLPSILEYLDAADREHFDRVREYLNDRSIPYTVQPRLVRGLDYYARTTFEITHDALGAQNAILGGGRYDGLAESLGSKVPAPGIGFSIGEDRLVMTVEQTGDAGGSGLDLYIAPMGDAALRHCTLLAGDIRKLDVSVEVGTERKLKRMLEIANKLAARFALIVGDDEIVTQSYSLKDMATGEQDTLTRQALLERLANSR
ncbi:MAG: histidine--tRNA ligase [Acidobacteriaceae bacterium]|nr:histidine--tRNA ligase [Acidobacteriaceae bacterium]MBV8572888.1 histidine--tRNA ligase [Acidobacteriaceae bacterium]